MTANIARTNTETVSRPRQDAGRALQERAMNACRTSVAADRSALPLRSMVRLWCSRSLRAGVIAGVLLCCGWTWTARAATYHVCNRTGNDGNDGLTPESAFATIAAAVSRCGPGDTLSLAATGTPYRESIVLRERGGEPGRPLIIEGNGAAISGLQAIPPEKWEVREDGTFFFPSNRAHGAAAPFLLADGTPLPRARTPNEIAPGQAVWTREGAYYRPDEGNSLSDCVLEGTMLTSGVAILSGSYITVRNLTAEYFANDGFNVHGNCRGLLFENIIGRHNGDDGFSIHADVGAVVQGGWFHHNNFGIQDINASQSLFHGVLVEHNRVIGVDFHGGFHSLVDAVVRDNAREQIRVGPNRAPQLGFADNNPMCTGLVFLKNVVVDGGTCGLRVRKGGAVAVAQSVFRQSAVGIHVEPEATCHLVGCIVTTSGVTELVCASTNVAFDGNVYHPGRITWLGHEYAPGDWDAYREASGQDANSLLQDPGLPPDAPFPLSPLRLTRENRQIVVGPTHPLVLDRLAKMLPRDDPRRANVLLPREQQTTEP